MAGARYRKLPRFEAKNHRSVRFNPQAERIFSGKRAQARQMHDEGSSGERASELTELGQVERDRDGVSEPSGKHEIDATAGALLVVSDQLRGFGERLFFDGSHE